MDSADVLRIREQFLAGRWPQFLERVQIDGLHGWSGQEVLFRFPVVAVVGENGTGKSTVLKVVASAYTSPNRKYFPSDFFPTTHWDQVSGVTLIYRIRRGDEPTTFSFSKPTSRWSYPAVRYERNVLWFDISRTLPLDASAGYARIAKLAAGEVATEVLSAQSRADLSNIMSRNYLDARFATPDVNERKQVGLVRRNFGEVSQFHQGAGEGATLSLIRSLQEVPDNSLIVIDEVEASLHPRAQRRLIRTLLQMSRVKRIQVVLSTHSPYILEELPAEARILLLPAADGLTVVYGASPEFALSRIDDAVHPETYVYVEDVVAEIWLREILATHPGGGELLPRIKISPVGPANVVTMLGGLGVAGRLPHRSVAVLDGDAGEAAGCLLLPGDVAPERVVFGELAEAGWADLHLRFGIGPGTLYEHLEDVVLTPDHHQWTTMVGDRVIRSARSVWETLCTEWCRTCLRVEDRDRLLNAIAAVVDGA